MIAKLNDHKPNSIGQASRISGITPAAISILLIWLKKQGLLRRSINLASRRPFVHPVAKRPLTSLAP